jgi:hypothetical protein
MVIESDSLFWYINLHFHCQNIRRAFLQLSVDCGPHRTL